MLLPNKVTINNLDREILQGQNNVSSIFYVVAKYAYDITISVPNDSYIISNYPEIEELFSVHSL